MQFFFYISVFFIRPSPRGEDEHPAGLSWSAVAAQPRFPVEIQPSIHHQKFSFWGRPGTKELYCNTLRVISPILSLMINGVPMAVGLMAMHACVCVRDVCVCVCKRRVFKRRVCVRDGCVRDLCVCVRDVCVCKRWVCVYLCEGRVCVCVLYVIYGLL